MSNIVQGHILKFLDKQSTPSRTSKRFCPEQTFGHSKQSPDWFKQKFSLQSKTGYQYKFDDSKYQQKFKYLSQKHNLNINNQQKKPFNEQLSVKNAIHNRKKGLLSQYLDNNSWMKDVIPLTGFQRNQQSRRLNHVDRDKKIETMRVKSSAYVAAKTASNFYSTKFSKMRSTIKTRQIKTSHERTHSNGRHQQMSNPQNLTLIPSVKQTQDQKNNSRSKSITLLIGQKQKIRSQRNKIAFNKIHQIQKVNLEDTLTAKKFKTIDAEFVQQRMIKTARQWGTGVGHGNFNKNISPTKSIERFDTLIGQQSSIQSRLKTMNRDLFNKKLSTPIVLDISDNFENHKFVSNQL